MKILNKVINWRSSIALLLILFGAINVHSQIIAEELFDEPTGANTGTMSDGSAWAAGIAGQCDGNAGVFSVQPSGFVIQDIEGFNCCQCGGGGGAGGACGDNQSEILFNNIDISNACMVDITIVWMGSTGMECDSPIAPSDVCIGGHDQMVAEYSVDGGAFVQFGYLCGNTPVQIPATGFTLSGTTLDIRITGGNQAGSEVYTIQSIIVASQSTAINGELAGGGELCGTSCTTVDWEISGGAPPYNITFNFTLGAFDFDFPIVANNTTGTINVCLDPDAIVPSYDAGTNTIILNEDFGSNATIELTNIVDDSGCIKMVTGQIVNITLVSPPNINTIPPITGVCIESGGMATVDLSLYDDDIDGNGNTVIYYSDPALTNEIGPIFMTSTNTTIFAVVFSSPTCMSDDISIQITLTLTPDLDPLGAQDACGEFVFPSISGTNLTGNASYYSGSGATGTQYDPGDIIMTTGIYFVYDDNNGCIDEVQFTVTLLPEPDIDAYAPIMECGEYILPPITGSNLSGNAVYHDLPGGIGNTYQPGTAITSSIALYAYDLFGPCADEELITILISEAPEIDLPTTLSACGYVILPEITGENVSSNAMFYNNANASGTSYNTGDTIFSTQIIFAFDAIGSCTDEVNINIDVTPGPILSAIGNVTSCDNYELPDFIDGQDLVNPNFYSGPDASGLAFEPGDLITGTTTIFVYDSVVGNGACFNQTSFLVTILSAPTAGEDVSANSCAGSIIDLPSLLDGTGSSNGVFSDINNTGALVGGDTLDLNLSAASNFMIAYIVENMCGIDTALINLEVVDETNAGIDQSNSICEGSLIDLELYVAGDPGGAFYNDGEVTPITDDLSTDGLLGQTVEVIYVVGDGTNCDADTSIYEFLIIDQPEFDTPLTVEACDFYQLTAIIGDGLNGSELYYTENFGVGTSYEPGDTIFTDLKLYLFYNSGNCQALDSFVIDIKQNSIELIQDQLCPGQSISVNGNTYDFDTPSGEEILPNAEGCDSTITVELNFFTIDTNIINSNLCFGESITVNGEIYDEAAPQGTEILAGMASTGCDSIIRIELTFTDAAITPINEMICSGDSILINNTYYSEDNPNGMDTIFLQGGCDSILDVSIQFFQINSGSLDTTICESESILINGTVYDIDNDSGSETLSGISSTGCDSLLTVSVSFYSITPGNLTGEFCPNEIIDTLGVTLDIDNPSAQATLQGASSQGCDSLVNINFTFIDVQEGLITETICEGGSITIEGTEYNEGNPTGSFIVPTADGCDSIVNVMLSFSPVEGIIEIVHAECIEGGTGYAIIRELNVASITQFYILDNVGDQVAIEFGDTIFNIEPGVHSLEILTGIGCATTIDFTIDDADIPIANIPSLVLIQEGDSYILPTALDPTNTILWTPDQDISCTDCIDPIFSPIVDTDYYLELTNSLGCVVYDTISIRVKQIVNTYVPNTFTPNQDGVNDIFSLFSEKEGLYDLFIYDRWGNKMYEGLELEANNSNMGWDGNFNGSNINPGVYAFYIEFTTPPATVESVEIIEHLVGSITIIR